MKHAFTRIFDIFKHRTKYTQILWKIRQATRINNNRVLKIMLNYRPNARRLLGTPLKRPSDEAEAGLSRHNS